MVNAVRFMRDRGMAYCADHMTMLDRLDDQLLAASEPTSMLFSMIIAGACTRIPTLRESAKAIRIDRLIDAGAWTDAAFAVLDLELPAWNIRRLVCENGEWLCSLSRQPNLPMAMDDTVDAVHEVMPLAILRALVGARQGGIVAGRVVSTVPAIRPVASAPVCCDNFA
jgi:hypothetical protein